MRLENFPDHIRPYILPKLEGDLFYRCLGCGREYSIEKLLYICPDCGQVLLIYDRNFDSLKKMSGETWHELFDYRKMVDIPALKGIFRFHEFIGPMLPLEAILYLGEGNTPMIVANERMQELTGLTFFFKNDGQNPSGSFKDRGMASALSYIHFLIEKGYLSEVLAICASTGDTSAAAALYAAYLQPKVKSAVLLPHKKVTSQQLSQPLGSGARVFEIPGVFDDCMKVVEALSERYNVALLNSKNAWRILGQESYAYEIAQDFQYQLADKAVVVPIGNAGNISAVMNGFLKFYEVGIIPDLPKIIGVQSEHANPVYRYYLESDHTKRKFTPIAVRPSVAQAAMIGNPVSMPRVIHLEKQYNQTAGRQRVFVVQVTEQHIMDWQLLANRNGHISCPHGGECLAGLMRAKQEGIISRKDQAVLDSTAHALKFAGFQDMYFHRQFPREYEIHPDTALMNTPVLLRPEGLDKYPEPGKPLYGEDFNRFVERMVTEIARDLKLQKT